MLASLALSLCSLLGVAAPAADDVDLLTGLEQDGRFTSFLEALEGTGLADRIRAGGEYTLFAPVDEAFAVMPPATLKALEAPENLEAVTQLVSYHVVGEAMTLEDIGRRMRPTTLQGRNVAIRWHGEDDHSIETARLLDRDLTFTNGIVHVLDGVIIPEDVTLISEADLYGKGRHTYEVDVGHSSVVFRVMHMGVGAQWGWFDEFEGELVVDTDEPENSSIALAVAVSSIDTRDVGRDRFLQTEQFFDAENHPGLLFVSTEVAPREDGHLDVVGDLTMRGMAREVSFVARKLGEGRFGPDHYKVGYEADFTIKRSDYGMTFGIPGVAGDEIRLIIALEGIRPLDG